jgi:hypothetical protein
MTDRELDELLVDAIDSSDWEMVYKAQQALRDRLAQPEWVGLMEEETIDLLPVGDWEIESTLDFAKAIEAKLKEKNT